MELIILRVYQPSQLYRIVQLQHPFHCQSQNHQNTQLHHRQEVLLLNLLKDQHEMQRLLRALSSILATVIHVVTAELALPTDLVASNAGVEITSRDLAAKRIKIPAEIAPVRTEAHVLPMDLSSNANAQCSIQGHDAKMRMSLIFVNFSGMIYLKSSEMQRSCSDTIKRLGIKISLLKKVISGTNVSLSDSKRLCRFSDTVQRSGMELMLRPLLTAPTMRPMTTHAISNHAVTEALAKLLAQVMNVSVVEGSQAQRVSPMVSRRIYGSNTKTQPVLGGKALPRWLLLAFIKTSGMTLQDRFAR